ncbi:MAG TPA: bifunctional YncE family protein/alkaline phosphatase family protein [Thermoanaerobaculia bacterium]|nr:bifunctional YncE family protein/alkaline phosphatase family protein [Thermoanaerobaculia bacterium]
MFPRNTPLAIVLAALFCVAADRRPGVVEKGVTLLPNGWRIAPAGRHAMVGDLPLALLVSPDSRWAIVTNDGYHKPTLSVVELDTLSAPDRTPVHDAWLGLAWHPDHRRFYASGGADGTVREYSWNGGRIALQNSFDVGTAVKEGFLGGLAVAGDGSRVFVVDVLGKRLSAVDVRTGSVARRADLPAEPYTCLLSPDGATLYVSLWGGARILLFDAATLAPAGEIAVGEHPNAMALSSDGARLFVACANTNSVWAVDLAAKAAREQISVAIVPDVPPGSTPNALALSPDGRTLLAANADNNAIAVVDVSRPGASRVAGFIPTGWYPTGVAFTPDGKRILILSGKGLTSMANPRGPQPGAEGDSSQYIGALLTGALSVLPVPDAAALEAYTGTVRRVTPLGPEKAPSSAARRTAIPRRAGEASPIRHVFYVIRENRTYDQVLGDVPKGNGDPALCLFGEDATPNAHALAREFVLLDNFYVNAEVSYDGHAFSTAAYAADFVEKVWPMNYVGRGGKYLSEGRGEMRNAYGNVTAPMHGYLWDACARAGVSFRSYGEFGHRGPTDDDDEQGSVEASVPGLVGHMSPTYPSWNLSIPDAKRIDAWLAEFREYEKNGDLPRLSIFHLPNDHTSGTAPGMPTPRAMIAENDAALGRLVEAISKSRYWKDSVIFVLEDDAQDGPDHVDAHRSVALAIGPYVRHGALDSTLYTTASMLRTIELILGLPPMSQYDAAATPMSGAFSATPNLATYTARPARVPLDEKNDALAFGSEASAAMDFDEPDRAPEIELDEILWKSVRGAASPMPPPVRSALVAPGPADDD